MFAKSFTFWRRILGSAPSPQEDHGAVAVEEDRRLWVRYPTELEGNVRLGENQENGKFLAKIRDLSVGGANLLVEHATKVGQMVTLELPADHDEVRTVLACVVRATPEEGGKWSLGCVFSRELTSADIGTFGARKTQAAPDDQRTWVRFQSNLKATYEKIGDPVPQSQPATVLNISANGIGLSVHPSLQAGSLLNVDLFDKDGRMVRTILACVVHTTQRAQGDYAVGCNFIRELSEEDLQSLL